MKTIILSLVFLTTIIFEAKNITFKNTPTEHKFKVAYFERDCWEEASAYGDEIAEDTDNPTEGFNSFNEYYLSCIDECGCVEELDPVIIN